MLKELCKREPIRKKVFTPYEPCDAQTANGIMRCASADSEHFPYLLVGLHGRISELKRDRNIHWAQSNLI